MTFVPFVRGLAALLFAASTTMAFAQTWPAKPIRIVVPAPAGGALDVAARIMADELRPAFGQPVIVDNKPGGAGMIGVADLLSAPADGHTIMLHLNGAVSEIPHVIKPRFDPFNDIKPIVQVARSGLVFVASSQFPVESVKDVVSYAKSNPGKVNYASYSAGTISHTLGVQLNALAGIQMIHVPYKGSPPALQDVVAGQVQLMFDGPATSVPMIKADRVKALAVTTPQRLAALPNVPTFSELGYPSMTEMAWIAFWTKPSVPPAVLERLRSETLKALQNPAVRERLATLGMEPGSPATSDELAKELRSAYDKQGALLKSINFTPE